MPKAPRAKSAIHLRAACGGTTCQYLEKMIGRTQSQNGCRSALEQADDSNLARSPGPREFA